MRKLALWALVAALPWALLLMAGCAPQATPFGDDLSKLAGTLNFDQAVAKWGPPHSLASGADGKVALYTNELDIQVQKLYLTFDSKGVLKSWRQSMWCCKEKRSGP